MEGYLSLWIDCFTRWKKYFFILFNEEIIFCDKKGGKRLGSLSLKISTLFLIPEKPLLLMINNGFNNLYLQTETIQEKIKWSNAIYNRQSELLNRDYDYLYNCNIDDMLKNYNDFSDEIKENLNDTQFSNNLSQIWVLHAKIEEIIDNLSINLKDNPTVMELFEEMINLVSTLKKILTNCTFQIKEERNKVLSLLKTGQKKDASAKLSQRVKKLSTLNGLITNPSSFANENIKTFVEEKGNTGTIIERSFFESENRENDESNSDNFFEIEKNQSFYELNNTATLNTMRRNSDKNLTTEFLDKIEISQRIKYNYLKNSQLLSLSQLSNHLTRDSLPELYNKDKIIYSSVLKQLDSTKFSPPIYLYEPLTLLQRYAETFEYSELLDQANLSEDPCRRLSYIMTYVLTSFSPLYKRYKIPFMSLVNETYEFYNEPKFTFIAEQLSFEPNLSVYYGYNMNFEVWTNISISWRIWGKYIEIETNGLTHIKLHKHKDLFVLPINFKIIISELDNEIPKISPIGELSFTNHETKDYGYIKFKEKSINSEKNDTIEGVIINSLGQKRFELEGDFKENIILIDSVTKKKNEIWKCKNSLKNEHLQHYFSNLSLQLNYLNFNLLEKISVCDSRFRCDVKALEMGLFKMSNEEKIKLEIKEKERKKYINNNYLIFEEKLDNITLKNKYVLKENWQKIKMETNLEIF